MQRRPQEEALQTMAKLFPVLSSVARRMTGGERRFASRLETHLEDDYLCWYDVPVGPAGAHPDFIILHPRRGILILEVKDWRLSSIQAFGKTSVTLVTEKGLKHTLGLLLDGKELTSISTILDRSYAAWWEPEPLWDTGAGPHGRRRLLATAPAAAR